MAGFPGATGLRPMSAIQQRHCDLPRALTGQQASTSYSCRFSARPQGHCTLRLEHISCSRSFQSRSRRSSCRIVSQLLCHLSETHRPHRRGRKLAHGGLQEDRCLSGSKLFASATGAAAIQATEEQILREGLPTLPRPRDLPPPPQSSSLKNVRSQSCHAHDNVAP